VSAAWNVIRALSTQWSFRARNLVTIGCGSTEDLQKELELIDPNILATDEMFTVLGKTVPLSPILGRLVRFEPSVSSIQEAHSARQELMT
jgi:hypothetical protein